MSSSVIFLGTGASIGVPIIGCHCETCQSKDPKNKRLRSSILLNIGSKHILVDAGPDFRQQALTHSINHLDGVIFTHSHHDHVGGIDDLRVYLFRNRNSLPCLVSKETEEDLRKRFYFMFKIQATEPIGVERLKLEVLPNDRGETTFLGVPIRYFTFEQLGMKVLGIRVGDFAYLTDIKHYPDTIFEDLKGVKTLVVSALRFTPSHMHFTVDDAIDFIQKVKPEKAYLTHISHDLEHEKAMSYLPASIELAYDGLKIFI